ncbi:MAG: SDR family oxidoreductase [Deltaproteobacteria bacterium]|nr:SDR family oxidoreductase [Deltaproteobacteria bacterium]
MFDLSGRTALVTGAGQGVGAGIARLLAAQGAKVAVNDLRAVRAMETVQSIVAVGGRAMTAVFDVADYAAVAENFERMEKQLGPIDILVNNAGIPEGMGIKPFRETEPEAWRPYIDVNLYGVLNCCRAVINGMNARRFGRIVTISSGAGTIGLALGVSPYAAGKGGAISFMRHLALENAGFGVTANTVALGLMNNQNDPTVTAHLAKTIPVGRLGEPEDVGALCVFLASNESSWMTGQTLQINGGNVTT